MDAGLVTSFSMGVFASRLSGKSVFTKNLLLQQNRMISTPFKKVICVYINHGKMNYLSNSFLKHCLKLIFGWSTQFRCDGKTGKYAYSYWWLYEWGFQFAQAQSLFTRGRHFGLSVIYLAQNLFHKGKYSRDLSLNMDYIVLFKTCEIRVKLVILPDKCFHEIQNL